MIYLFVTVPLVVLSFFVGFYLRVLLHTLVDALNVLQKLNFHQEVAQQQAQLSKAASTGVQFVEPQSLAEIEAQEEMERIKALNNVPHM